MRLGLWANSVKVGSIPNLIWDPYSKARIKDAVPPQRDKNRVQLEIPDFCGFIPMKSGSLLLKPENKLNKYIFLYDIRQ